MMLLDKLIKIIFRLAILLAVFLPSFASAQALSSEESCRKLGFQGTRKMTPGLLPSMVLRSMDPRIQCGIMFNRGDTDNGMVFDPENDPKAKKFLDDSVRKSKSLRSAGEKAARDYFKQKESNLEKERNRKDPAKYLVSLIIDSDIEEHVFRSKLEELKRFGEKQVVSVGAVMVLGMEKRIRENVDNVLNKMYANRRKKSARSEQKTAPAIDFSSLKMPSNQDILNSSMSDVEKIIVSLHLRRKGSANVRSVVKEKKIDRLPVWIFHSKDEEVVFDGKQELTGLIDNFGELNYEKKLDSSAASPGVIARTSGRDFVYIEDRINPRMPGLSPDLRIPGRKKEGIKRF